MDVIERDEQTLRQTGISAQQIADRLESLVGQARYIQRTGGALLTSEVVVEKFFKVSRVGYRGSQDCPFEDTRGEKCQETGSEDFSVEHLHDQSVLSFPALAIHLIRDHHFFEGNVLYRVEPEQAIAVLGLEPGINYAPKRRTEAWWVPHWGAMRPTELSGPQQRVIDEILAEPDEDIDLGGEGRVIVRGEQAVIFAIERVRLPEAVKGARLEDERFPPGIWFLERRVSSYIVP